jgi:hypothetical protein
LKVGLIRKSEGSGETVLVFVAGRGTQGQGQRAATGAAVSEQRQKAAGSDSDQVRDGGLVTSGSFTGPKKVAVERGRRTFDEVRAMTWRLLNP